MAKRGRKPKSKFNSESLKGSVRPITAIICIALGGVSLLAVIAGFLGEDFESVIQRYTLNLFGATSILVSILLVYFGILYVGSLTLKFLNYRILTGLIALLVGLSGMFGTMAGLFGEFLISKSSVLFSKPGAIFLFFLITFGGVAFILNIGITGIFAYFSNIIDFVRTKVLRIELPDEDGEEVEEEEEEEDEHQPSLLPPAGYNVSSFDKQSESADFDTSEIGPDDDDLEEISAGYVDEQYRIIDPPSGPIGENDYLDDFNARRAKSKVSPGSKKAQIEDIDENLEDEEIEETEETSKAKNKKDKLPFTNKIWEYPSLDILSSAPNKPADAGNVSERAKAIEDTLNAFGIKGRVVDIKTGPAVTQYALDIAIGTKASKISNLATDLALRIKSPSGSVRVVAPIPGTNLVGVEVPNFSPSSVSLRSVLSSPDMKKVKNKLSIPVGIDVQGNTVVHDITKWPHSLIAGSTGSGKSVMLNAIISSLLFRCSPSECRFIMIDPKMVEMVQYNDIPHLLTPVVTDVEQKAVSALAWAVSEMERRYKLFSTLGVRNLESYNAQAGFQAEPYIVILIDELADMMMVASADVEKYIARLAQKSRATGIHLIIATQRPSVNVLTGIIKANIPTRIAFKVASNTDSRVIIDQSGAETLIGRGDMLFVPPNDSKAVRLQGVWVHDDEIVSLVNMLKNSGLEPDYKEEILQQKVSSKAGSGGSGNGKGGLEGIDEKMSEALELVLQDGKASASYLQRRLSLGYSRAARIIDELEIAGIIGSANGSKPRDVLIGSYDEAVVRLTGGGDDEDEE
jgi:DNA segregation ATPase FtsK/SpoIIIE-like protein